MTLNAELKKQAEKDLAEMVEVVRKTAYVFEGVDPPLLLKLALGGKRCKTLRVQAISQLVARHEVELMKIYNDQKELFEKETKEKL